MHICIPPRNKVSPGDNCYISTFQGYVLSYECVTNMTLYCLIKYPRGYVTNITVITSQLSVNYVSKVCGLKRLTQCGPTRRKCRVVFRV